jgi:hypothetical protein
MQRGGTGVALPQGGIRMTMPQVARVSRSHSVGPRWPCHEAEHVTDGLSFPDTWHPKRHTCLPGPPVSIEVRDCDPPERHGGKSTDCRYPLTWPLEASQGAAS